MTLDKFFKQNNNIITKTESEQKNILYGYKLPKEWKVVELAKIFKEVNKNARKVRIKDNETYKLITVRLYAKGIVLRDVKLGKDIKTKTMFRVKAGDFIFSKIDARNGAYGFVPQELDGPVVSSDFPILELDRSKAIDKFVYYYMSQPIIWETIRSHAVGTTNRKRVNVSEFLRIVKIPLPPLEEQYKIVYVLDTIKHAIEVQDRLLDTLNELKRALMNRLFTKGLDPNKPTKLTEIGEIPAHWEVVKLGKIIRFRNGKRPKFKKDGTIRIYGAGYLQGYTDEVLVNEPYVIIIARVGLGTVGKVYIASGQMWITDNAIYGVTLQQNSVYLPFFYYYLNYLNLENYAERKAGGKYAIIKISTLNNLYVPFPPLNEQRKITDILSKIDEKIKLIKQKRNLFEELFGSMLHKLMSGQIRVTNLDETYFGERPSGV